MAQSDRVGIYLSDRILVLADTNRNKLVRVLSASLDSISTIPKEPTFSPEAIDEIQIVSFVQKLFRDNKINAGQICVAIPIEEVFLRSFVIPWMSLNELNNAVYYEAKKYLPFDLKLLEYSYQPVVQLENNQKRWRIIFYAVRKQTLEKYDRIVKQIGGKPYSFEPALVSLAKHLISKKYLRMDQSTVVVYIHENDVHIIFYEKGIAYFVRDFVLSVDQVNDPKAHADVIRAQLLREVRKSFGYYNSQFSQEKIKEILLLSSTSDQELNRILTEELSVKVRTVEPSITIGLQKYLGMETLCACGSCLEKVSSKFNSFNFLQSKNAPQVGGANALAFDLSQMFGLTFADLKYALQAAIICSILLGGVYFLGQKKLQEIKLQNEKMSKTEEAWINKSVDQIQLEMKAFNDKLNKYKEIQNQRTYIAQILVVISRALPSGVWLQDAKVVFLANKHLKIDINAYFYLKDKGADYTAVSEFLDNLRASRYFADLIFNETSHQKKEVDERPVVAFSITGS